MELTQEYLKQILHYDPLTGIFTWLEFRGNNRISPGDIAGSFHPRGYRKITIDEIPYSAHRLAWFYVHGRWPQKELDHKNRQRSDNRIDNLREATRFENRQNQGIRPSNTSGFIGVSWRKDVNKWQAKIGVKKKYIHLGLFDSAEDAGKAYATAKQKLHTFSKEQHG